MVKKNTNAEFDALADIFERLIARDPKRPPINPGCQAAIDRLKPRSILDCACGQGRSSIALKKAGYMVHGSDISSEMVRLARRNGRKKRLRIPFTVAAWHELPAKFSRRFDFVMCHGHSISHCRGERDMVKSLRAIRKVTKDGGQFYLDTRSWEWFRRQSTLWFPGNSLEDKDGYHTTIFRAPVPKKWSDPHVVETVYIVEKDGAMRVEAHPITLYAFKFAELKSRLRTAGFSKIETDYSKESSHYWVLAEAI